MIVREQAQTPIVSICIPTYNGAKYLAECLDSVINQTFTNFEIVLVDDCSTDGTLEIAQDYAFRDKRIRIFVNQQNLGLVGNWNYCVRQSRGEWIKFVFQDDLIMPMCLELMLATGKENHLLISCERNFIFEEGVSEQYQQFYLNHKAEIEALYAQANEIPAKKYCEMAHTRPSHNFMGEPTAVMLRKSCFERFGYFNPNLIMSCDAEYWTRVASHTGTIHIPEVLAKFRVHKGATSAVNMAKRRYRMDVLDPLIVLHDFAFHPIYCSIRAMEDSHLAELFWERAYWALWTAKHAVSDPKAPDVGFLNEWEQVAQAYPRCASIPLKFRILTKWNALKKNYFSKQNRN